MQIDEFFTKESESRDKIVKKWKKPSVEGDPVGSLEMFWCKICSLSDQDAPPGWRQVGFQLQCPKKSFKISFLPRFVRGVVCRPTPPCLAASTSHPRATLSTISMRWKSYFNAHLVGDCCQDDGLVLFWSCFNICLFVCFASFFFSVVDNDTYNCTNIFNSGEHLPQRIHPNQEIAKEKKEK